MTVLKLLTPMHSQTGSKNYTGPNFYYKLKKVLESQYKITPEQFRCNVELRNDGFVAYLNITNNAVPNKFKGVQGFSTVSERHAEMDACQKAYNGLIQYQKNIKHELNTKNHQDLKTDYLKPIHGLLDRVRKETGLEDMKNPPIYQNGTGKNTFIAKIKNDKLCPESTFSAESNSKKDARIHAEAKLLCYIFRFDTRNISEFLQTRNGLITMKKVGNFLRENESFDFKPDQNRKRKAEEPVQNGVNADSIENNNVELKNSMNSAKSRKIEKKETEVKCNNVRLDNNCDDLLDYEDEMEDDNSVATDFFINCPDRTLHSCCKNYFL